MSPAGELQFVLIDVVKSNFLTKGRKTYEGGEVGLMSVPNGERWPGTNGEAEGG